MIFGFCVFFCIYEVEKMRVLGKMTQKCEQFSYAIFSGIFLRFGVLKSPLTSLKHRYCQVSGVLANVTPAT